MCILAEREVTALRLANDSEVFRVVKLEDVIRVSSGETFIVVE